uniref:Uncharacterized protein n=1 Tax=Heterorhabditis bacteriophora TaxID=37862 RepID=A0A1I7XEY6_HETBA
MSTLTFYYILDRMVTSSQPTAIRMTPSGGLLATSQYGGVTSISLA